MSKIWISYSLSRLILSSPNRDHQRTELSDGSLSVSWDLTSRYFSCIDGCEKVMPENLLEPAELGLSSVFHA